jgi:hypothetical protein
MSNLISLSQQTNSFLSFASYAESLEALKKSLTILLDSSFITRPSQSQSQGLSPVSRFNFKKNFKKNKLFYIPVGIIIVVILFGMISIVRGKGPTPTSVMSANSDQRVELKPALSTQKIDKTFSFPLKDGNGKEVSKIKYTVEAAELRDEIIVKGQRATSVKGRTFLILPIKIQNDYNQPVEINARDYVRLIINNNQNEKLAPDIHNDPVEVQAISTKQTRLGFPIDDTVTNIVLQVGEIKGKKENITITVKK